MTNWLSVTKCGWDRPEQELPPVEDVWLFYLDEIAPGATRLIAHNRRDYEPTAANFIV